MKQKTEQKEKVKEDKPAHQEKEVVQDDGLTEKERERLRNFLEDGCEFKGLEKTVIAVLKKTKQEMKLKALAKTITLIYKLSEDFDSESEDEEDGWLANRK